VFYRHFESLHLDVLRPMPGAPALIAGLAHLGVPIGVVSNKNGSYLRKEIEHLGWSDVFETTVGACDAKRDKPHPDPVFAALASTGRAGDMRRVWFVGDTDIDLQCAANSGCTAVLLRPLPPGREEFAGCRPHIHVADCLALLSTVQNLLG
jgi:phosphoglycolate phosphatase